MTKKAPLFLSLILLILIAVNCGESTQASADQIRIGTWNLEWFGALGRTPEDITRIADIIREQDIDILALEEITCECTLQALAEELGYEYYLSSQRVPQKLALLWRSEAVDEINFDTDAYNALRRVADTGLDRESRQPLVFRVVAGNFDFTLVVVHLKAIPELERSVEIRNVQYDTINAWLAAELSSANAERDIIIAGDFNSYLTGISSARLLQGGHVVFATKDLPESEYSNIWHDRDGNRNLSLIDHIAITPTLKNEEFITVEPIPDLDAELGGDDYENHISDHLPVVAVFSTDRDRD